MALRMVTLVDADSRGKRNPDGFPRKYRADRIDVVGPTYVGGGCTITVNGAHFHVEEDQEDVIRMIDKALM